ncbi:MAG: hypothetical protein JEZ06_01100 [Anaerolineaceae bacterium]|nr:hypothetical protein [Anaerolineaceae bacterium]
MIKKRKSFLFILSLSVFEGVIGCICYFLTPSADKNVDILGLSLSRLLIGAGFTGLVLVLLGITFWLYYSKTASQRFLKKFAVFIESENRLLILLTGIVGILMFFSFGFILYNIEWSIDLNMSVVVFNRVMPMIIWFIALLIQMGSFLITVYKKDIYSKDFFDIRVMLKTLIIELLFLISFTHWIILIFQIQFMVAIPYWTWHFDPKETINWLAVLGMLVCTICFLYMVLKDHKQVKRNILLLILLGIVLQVGIGFAEGEGFKSLSSQELRSGHKVYLEHAVDNPDWQHIVRNYEDAYGWNVFLGTKPPGVILTYILSQKLSNLINPVSNYADRLIRLSTFNSFFFPIISFLIVIVLYCFSKSYFEEAFRLFPAIIFLFLPNVILMALELDQVIFPLCFFMGLVVTGQLIKTQRMGYAFLLGIYLYLANYLTFSMLPLVLMAGLWISLDYIFNRNERSFMQLLKQAALVILGFIILFILFKIALNYDPLVRFQNAMNNHTHIKEYQSGFKQLLDALYLNNLEISAWIGFPIAILVLMRLVRSIYAIFKCFISRMDVLSLAFLLTYAFLNLVGQTRGEVGRLWLFLTPLFAIFAAYELVNIFKNKQAGLVYLTVIQFATLFLTFYFQDFW